MISRRARRGLVLPVLVAGLVAAGLPAHAAVRRDGGAATVRPTTRLYGVDTFIDETDPSSGIAVYDGVTFRQIGYHEESYNADIGTFLDLSVQAGSNGRLAVTAETTGGDCTAVEILDGSGHRRGWLPASLNQHGHGALSGDGTTWAYAGAPGPADADPDAYTCADGSDRIELVPTGVLASDLPVSALTSLPRGVAIDRGWGERGLAVAPDDHTVAVSVARPHSKVALDLVDTRTATRLSQGRVFAAAGCDLLAPTYVTQDRLVALRVCAARTDVVAVKVSAGTVTSLGVVPPHTARSLDAAPDGRLLVGGAYVMAAGGTGGLRRIRFSNLPQCPLGGRPDTCSFTAQSW